MLLSAPHHEVLFFLPVSETIRKRIIFYQNLSSPIRMGQNAPENLISI